MALQSKPIQTLDNKTDMNAKWLQWVIALLVTINTGANALSERRQTRQEDKQQASDAALADQIQKLQDKSYEAMARIADQLASLDKRVVTIESNRFTTKDGLELTKDNLRVSLLLNEVSIRLKRLEDDRSALRPSSLIDHDGQDSISTATTR